VKNPSATSSATAEATFPPQEAKVRNQKCKSPTTSLT
jgi:hypothetical protein